MSALLVVASMWGTLTTISPTNPLIRWPELAKSNLREADGEAQEEEEEEEIERRVEGVGGTALSGSTKGHSSLYHQISTLVTEAA